MASDTRSPPRRRLVDALAAVSTVPVEQLDGMVAAALEDLALDEAFEPASRPDPLGAITVNVFAERRCPHCGERIS